MEEVIDGSNDSTACADGGLASGEPAALDNLRTGEQSEPQRAMSRRHRCSLVLVLFVTLPLSLGSSRAMAHPATLLLEAHPGSAQPGASTGGVWGIALWLIAGVGLLRVAARPVRRRAIAMGLSLALGVFGLESAVHSVHHLTSPETAATCPVFPSTEHLGWGEIPVVASDASPPHVTAAPAPARETSEGSLTYRPRPGRAPPA
jgi:hypothetical protein